MAKFKSTVPSIVLGISFLVFVFSVVSVVLPWYNDALHPWCGDEDSCGTNESYKKLFVQCNDLKLHHSVGAAAAPSCSRCSDFDSMSNTNSAFSILSCLANCGILLAGTFVIVSRNRRTTSEEEDKIIFCTLQTQKRFGFGFLIIFAMICNIVVIATTRTLFYGTFCTNTATTLRLADYSPRFEVADAKFWLAVVSLVFDGLTGILSLVYFLCYVDVDTEDEDFDDDDGSEFEVRPKPVLEVPTPITTISSASTASHHHRHHFDDRRRERRYPRVYDDEYDYEDEYRGRPPRHDLHRPHHHHHHHSYYYYREPTTSTTLPPLPPPPPPPFPHHSSTRVRIRYDDEGEISSHHNNNRNPPPHRYNRQTASFDESIVVNIPPRIFNRNNDSNNDDAASEIVIMPAAVEFGAAPTTTGNNGNSSSIQQVVSRMPPANNSRNFNPWNRRTMNP